MPFWAARVSAIFEAAAGLHSDTRICAMESAYMALIEAGFNAAANASPPCDDPLLAAVNLDSLPKAVRLATAPSHGSAGKIKAAAGALAGVRAPPHPVWLDDILGPLESIAMSADSLPGDSAKACLDYLQALVPGCTAFGPLGPLGRAVVALERRLLTLPD
jgi:hypothetical protein